MENDRPLHGKTAWVTGASRGIGRAITMRFAEAGAEVCFGARAADQLKQIEEILKNKGLKGHGIELDVSSKESVAAFAEQATKAAGGVDILVNNAGVGIFQDIDVMTHETFEKQIDVGIKGAWYMVKAAAPSIRRQGGGAIINISSLAGKHPFKRGTAYCAAKAALNAMSECLMLELREYGIRVVTVAPGSVETRFHQEALPQANVKDQSWMMAPETVAEACLYVLTQPENTLSNYIEMRPLQTGK